MIYFILYLTYHNYLLAKTKLHVRADVIAVLLAAENQKES